MRATRFLACWPVDVVMPLARVTVQSVPAGRVAVAEFRLTAAVFFPLSAIAAVNEVEPHPLGEIPEMVDNVNLGSTMLMVSPSSSGAFSLKARDAEVP